MKVQRDQCWASVQISCRDSETCRTRRSAPHQASALPPNLEGSPSEVIDGSGKAGNSIEARGSRLVAHSNGSPFSEPCPDRSTRGWVFRGPSNGLPGATARVAAIRDDLLGEGPAGDRARAACAVVHGLALADPDGEGTACAAGDHASLGLIANP